MNKETIKIACVGDSITYGETLDDIVFESHPAQLEMLLGDKYVVGNYGRNGTSVWRYSPLTYKTTFEYKYAVEMEADIIIVCLGSNDTPNPQNEDFMKGFREDYLDLIAHLRQRSPEARLFLAIISPIPKYPQLVPAVTNINSLIQATSRECGASIVGLHPNAAGARLIAETVYNAINEQL